MDNAKLLLKIGSNLYEKNKNFIFFAPIALIALVITFLFCGEYAAGYAVLSGHYFLVNFLVFGFYVMILMGVVAVGLYFIGLVLLGLGQIAMNTIPGQHTFVGNLVMETENGKVSQLLLNSIKHAISLESDEDMVSYLQSTFQRLNKPSEKKMLQRILEVPSGNIRSVAEQFLKKLTEEN